MHKFLFLLCFNKCHLFCYVGGSSCSTLGLENLVSRGSEHILILRLNGDGLWRQENNQSYPPPLPDKLGNFLLAWKEAKVFIASHPVHMGKVLTSEMYCNNFSLWFVFFLFLNWKMSWFLWAVEAWALKKINELFHLKLIYCTVVHSHLCTLHVVPAAVYSSETGTWYTDIMPI